MTFDPSNVKFQKYIGCLVYINENLMNCSYLRLKCKLMNVSNYLFALTFK